MLVSSVEQSEVF